MAYKIEKDYEYGAPPSGVATPTYVQKIADKLREQFPKFYELEPAEVIQVYIDDTDPYFPTKDDPDDPTGNPKIPNYSAYGSISARLLITKLDDPIRLKPLDSNIKEYPLPGEYVIAVSYLNDGLKPDIPNYYTQKINLLNTVNYNRKMKIGDTDIGKPKFFGMPYKKTDFSSDSKIRQLQADDGDVTFNGRFGQSIRFGSNMTKLYDENEEEPREPLPDSGKRVSPNIIIRAGQANPAHESIPDDKKWDLSSPHNVGRPVRENINLDNSSIWITTDQTVPLEFAAKSEIKNRWAEKLEGNQVIINSDRLVFNSKLNNTYISSKKTVDISANDGIVLQIPTAGVLKLGDVGSYEPVLGGDQTMVLISDLCDIVDKFAKKLIAVVGGYITPVALPDLNVAASGLTAELTTFKSRLDTAISKTVFVDHGPRRR